MTDKLVFRISVGNPPSFLYWGNKSPARIFRVSGTVGKYFIFILPLFFNFVFFFLPDPAIAFEKIKNGVLKKFEKN